MKLNSRNRSRMKKRRCMTRRIAGAPTSAYNQDGHINRVWVMKNTGYDHVTFVVDPDGTGTYCHSTIKDNRDPTIKYHYGYEVNNPRRRDMGLHFWTTPYNNEHRLDDRIKHRLVKLFTELCDDDKIDQHPSILLKSKKRKNKSKTKTRTRSRTKTRSRSRSKSRSRSRSK